MKSALKLLLKVALPKSMFDRLRLLRIRTDRKHFRARVVEHSFGGRNLKVMIKDRVGEDWYDRPWPAAEEINLLKQFSLRPGARIFDIGAHQGVVAMMLAAEVKQGGQVVAVEASPLNASIARENFTLNAVENAVVKHAAAAAAPGKLVLNEDSNGQIDDSGNLGRIEVDAITIDQLSEEFGQPDLIFLDIEGFEVHALKGAKQTLENAPDLFIEVHVGAGLEKFGGSIEELLSLLPIDQYQLYFSEQREPLRFIECEQTFLLDSNNEKVADRFFLAAVKAS